MKYCIVSVNVNPDFGPYISVMLAVVVRVGYGDGAVSRCRFGIGSQSEAN